MTWERVLLGKAVIGLVDRERKVYRIQRRCPADVARKLNSCGIDEDTANRLHAEGVETVEVEERNGGTVRLFTTDLDDWLRGPRGSLGGTGKRHVFYPLVNLPKPEVLRREPCGRLLLCCGQRCKMASGHFQQDPLHECPTCRRRTTN